MPKKLLQFWNFLGLLVIFVIIVVFLTTIYKPEIYGSDTLTFLTNFGWYPYVLIPGFLMPSAVFVHVLSLIQLKNKPRKEKISF